MVNASCENTLVLQHDLSTVGYLPVESVVPVLPFVMGTEDDELREVAKYLVGICQFEEQNNTLAAKNRNFFGFDRFGGSSDIREACARVLGGY